MATKIIKYIPKNTAAGTEYREISQEDMSWIQTQLIRYLTVMAELDQTQSDDEKWVLNQWWHKKSNKVHKGRQGLNTPASVVGGVLNNLLFKEPQQRDFTDKQISDIEYISVCMAALRPDLDSVRFQIGFEFK